MHHSLYSRASANVVAKARAIRVRSDIPEHSIEHTYCTVCTAVSTPRDATGRGGTRCLLGMRGKGRRIAAVAPAMAMTRINLISFWIWSRLSSRRVPAPVPGRLPFRAGRSNRAARQRRVWLHCSSRAECARRYRVSPNGTTGHCGWHGRTPCILNPPLHTKSTYTVQYTCNYSALLACGL